MLVHIITVRDSKNVPVQQCRLAYTDVSQANQERDRIILSRVFTSIGGDTEYLLQKHDSVVMDTLPVVEPVSKEALERHLHGVAFKENPEFKPTIPVKSSANMSVVAA